jgi:hypothetical protein
MVSRTVSLESGFYSDVGGWQDEMGAGSDQLFFVTSYSDFEKLGTLFGRFSLTPELCSLNGFSFHADNLYSPWSSWHTSSTFSLRLPLPTF